MPISVSFAMRWYRKPRLSSPVCTEQDCALRGCLLYAFLPLPNLHSIYAPLLGPDNTYQERHLFWGSGQGQQLCTRILNHSAVPNNNQELRERGQLPKMKQDEERGLLLVSGPSIGNSSPASHTPPQPPNSFPSYRMTGCTHSCLVPFPFAN